MMVRPASMRRTARSLGDDRRSSTTHLRPVGAPPASSCRETAPPAPCFSALCYDDARTLLKRLGFCLS